ncbi:hypothetical protein LCGC14_0253810 [marine sediment metagenome]|uniref:Uncharacterized protein n=1 Tax=marine sediment metagenome TaxID=412755 RepID=A0A0F9U3P5_9ZZZZ|nr:hypothetical protein [Phycisphaerae bacterium]
MTTVTFICEACGKQLSVADDLVGKEVQCPLCEAIVQAPQTSPAVASSQAVAQGVRESYPAARLDYEGGLTCWAILLIEIVIAAGGLGIWAGSAWVFGGSLLGMFVSLFAFRKLAMVLGIALGVLGGALGGVLVYNLWDYSVGAGIVGGILIGLFLVGANIAATQFTRQTT